MKRGDVYLANLAPGPFWCAYNALGYIRPGILPGGFLFMTALHNMLVIMSQ